MGDDHGHDTNGGSANAARVQVRHQAGLVPGLRRLFRARVDHDRARRAAACTGERRGGFRVQELEQVVVGVRHPAVLVMNEAVHAVEEGFPNGFFEAIGRASAPQKRQPLARSRVVQFIIGMDEIVKAVTRGDNRDVTVRGEKAGQVLDDRIAFLVDVLHRVFFPNGLSGGKFGKVTASHIHVRAIPAPSWAQLQR